MEEIGIFNDRKLIYQQFSSERNLSEVFPKEQWLLLVVIENKEKFILNEIAKKAIDGDCCFICCVGNQAELLHDIIDNEIVFREVNPGNHHLPPYDVIMTTWHADMEEATWYSLFAALNDPEIIGTVFCLDVSEIGIKTRLSEIINRFNKAS
jgi:hypothetical protein